MGCGAVVARRGGFFHTVNWPGASRGTDVEQAWGDSASSSQKAFQDILPTPFLSHDKGSCRPALTFIQEEDETERQVLFLDIVLVGPHAALAADGACSGADPGVRTPLPSFAPGGRAPGAEEELPARHPAKANGDSDAAALAALLGDSAAHEVPTSMKSAASSKVEGAALEGQLMDAPALPEPPAATLLQRRSSTASLQISLAPTSSLRQCERRFSSERRVSGLSSMPRSFSCNCQVRGFKASVHLWPVETLSAQLPKFPVSQFASTGYVALLPVESSSLSDECATVRQRFDEVRFNAARALQAAFGGSEGGGPQENSTPASPSLASKPRLGRVALYNTEVKHMNCVESGTPTTSDPGEAEEVFADCIASATADSDVGAVAGATADIGVADLCDTASLFQTVVVKTAEWLLSCGAVAHARSLDSLPTVGHVKSRDSRPGALQADSKRVK